MKWDLTKLFSTEKEWETSFEEVVNLIPKAASFKGTLSDESTFVEYELFTKDLSIKFYKVYLYAHLAADLNLKDTDANARQQRVFYQFSQLSQATAWYRPEVLEIGKDTIMSFLDRHPEIEENRFGIEKLFRAEDHTLDAKGESIMSNFGQVTSQGSQIYSALSTADRSPETVTLSTGEDVTVTQGSYRNLQSSLENPQDRQLVFETLYKHYREHKNAFAQIYATILKSDVARMKSRGYESTLDSYLYSNNIPTDVYHNLVDVVKTNTEPLKRYYKIRKEAFGLDQHHTYDRFMQLANSDSTFTYVEGKQLFFDSIAHFSNDFQDKAKSALEDGYVDVFEKDGKRTGAYSSSVLDEHPYILLNYDETLDAVFTLAHEAGHSMHSLYAQEAQPASLQNYTIFVAEIASTFNEHNLLDYIIKSGKASKDDKIQLLQQSIDDIMGTFYRQALFAAFELEAHTLAEAGQPITHESLSAIMIDLYKTFYDIDISKENGKELVWAYIPHFYGTPYYVYQYATSFAASLRLYEMVLEDPKNIEKHISLLKSGGSEYPVDQVLKSGVDLTTKEPFMAVVNRLNSLLDQLEIALKE